MSLMVVARFSTNGEAGIAWSALEAAGIDAVLADDAIIAIDWRYSNAVGRVKLVVRGEDLGDAADVLSLAAEEPGTGDEATIAEPAADATPATTAAVSASASLACPACGSLEAARIPRLSFFLFFSVVLGGVGLAVGQNELAVAAVFATALIAMMVPSHRCTKCGERWDAGESGKAGDDRPGPPPDLADTIEERCPRCGSANFHDIDHRRLKAITLLISVTIVVVLLVWPFLPRKHCDDCGLDV